MQIIKENQFDQVVSTGITLVDFYADWCGPCKMLTPVLEGLAEDNPNVKFVKVNCDDDPALCARFNISSIPNLILFKDGKVVNHTLGYQSEDELQEFINSAL